MRTPQSKHIGRRSLWEVTKRWVQLKRIRGGERFVADASDQGPELQDLINLPDGNCEIRSPLSDLLFAANTPDTTSTNYIDTQELRLFVGTWNVAGKAPTNEWTMQEWLGSLQEPEPADIYVIGFQEIVPLNAGNVLGSEEYGVSASKWDALIRATLNEFSYSSRSSYLHLGTRKSFTAPPSPSYDDILLPDCHDEEIDGHTTRHSFADENNLIRRISSAANSSISATSSRLFSLIKLESDHNRGNYTRIASKQMVGLFISVWVRRDLRCHVKAVEVSSVGCGIMGCLGNKGAISVSLSLHETNFCFICSHLKSGDRSGDAVRRNSDVTEILRRTKFRRSKKVAALMNLPETILAHDRIVWFGDLNYRVSLRFEELKSLVANEDWEALLEKDQLKYEQGVGGVFEGWNEGPISFAPTYKYKTNSDLYCMVHAKEGAKKRAPAWCDRILWYGKGLKQISYTRSESKHSDHRPVGSIFMAEVEMLKKSHLITNFMNHDIVSPFSITKVEVQEILPANLPQQINLRGGGGGHI